MKALRLLSLLGLVALMGCGVQKVREASLQTKLRNEERAGAEDQAPAAPAGAAQAAPAEPEPRKIIYTANVDLVVDDFATAEQQLMQLVQEHKGYVAKSDVSGTAGFRRNGSWTVRVPVDRYEAFRQALTGLGELTRSKLDSQDVTDEYHDLEAGIKNKKEEEERLREHLKKSTGKLEDILAVERELTRVRGEIERQQGRLQYLSRLTALTTVTVTVQERKDYVPPTSPAFGTTVGRTFWGSVEVLEDFGKAIVLVAVALAPWLPIVLVIALVLRFLIRRVARFSAGRREPPTALPVGPVGPA
jgi:hypothetical protein